VAATRNQGKLGEISHSKANQAQSRMAPTKCGGKPGGILGTGWRNTVKNLESANIMSTNYASFFANGQAISATWQSSGP
jgi:hypothetical protein